MSSSYEKVKTKKLIFKGGGLGLEKKKSKKAKKQKLQKDKPVEEEENAENGELAEKPAKPEEPEIDTGTGHAPDGKKSKKYEELFPVETKKHGYVIPDSRSAALDERIKKKADRYCK